MKSKIACYAVVVIIVFLPCFSIAGEIRQNDPPLNGVTVIPDSDLRTKEGDTKPPQRFANHAFAFGFMYHYFDYKEDVPYPKKSTEKGWLPGFSLGWNYNKKNAVYSKVFVEFSYGDTEYEGTDQSGIIPIKYSDDNDQILFRGEWDIGYHIVVTKNISLIPYAGYGYRYWSRGRSEWRPVHYGSINVIIGSIKERYSWHYLPFGVAAVFTLGDKLFLEPNAGIRWMFHGRMKAYFSELDSRDDNPEFKLGNKVGWFAEIPLRCKFSPLWSVVIKPWYEYSKIGRSNDVEFTCYSCGYPYRAIAHEPASRTHQYGLNVGMVFSY